MDRYLQLMHELKLNPVKAVDTHPHVDHITGLGALRDRTHCITVMGEQNGDPRTQYDSLFGRLLKLPDETLVYPAHDYKGDTVSTIGEERAHNPRRQVKSAQEYVDLMNNLHLANPKMMDVAVPANMKQGLAQAQIARLGWGLQR